MYLYLCHNVVTFGKTLNLIIMTTYDGSDFIVEIDTVTANTGSRGTEANFKATACLTQNAYEAARASQTTTNKCSGDFEESLPSTFSWSITLEGQIMKLGVGETSDYINATTLKELHKAGTVFFARIADAVLSADGYSEGKGYLTDYSEQFPTKDVTTFSATFKGTGEPFFAPVTP